MAFIGLGRCSCSNLLRSSLEQQRHKCLECQIAEALKAGVGSLGEPLPVPVPPMLEEACGYSGTAHLVAFFWGAGDEAYYHDGRICATGEWDAYLAFVNHRCIRPYLTPYNLGSSEEPATDWLVLDRTKRQVMVQRHDEALKLLREQWPSDMRKPTTPIRFERWEEITAAIERLRHESNIPPLLDIEKTMREHQKTLQEMIFWLENFSSQHP